MNNTPLRIAPGEIVGIEGTGRRCIITQLLPGGLVGVRDCGSRQPPEKVSVGLLIHPPPPSEHHTSERSEPSDLIPLPDRELSDFSKEEWDQAKRRLEIIRPLLKVHRPPATLVKLRAKESGCHWTRIYYWMRVYRNSGRLLSSLMDGTPSVPKGTFRLHPYVEKLVDNVIISNYLTKQRLRVSKVDEALKLAWNDGGELMEKIKALGLQKPHLNTVRARINAKSPREVAEAREGDDKATKFTVTGSGFVANFPLEFVQIDHTRINVILRDDKTGCILGRPWITIAICVFSRMIVGYYISFETPGAIGTGLCISHLILPKDDWLREYAHAFATMPEWPCYGRPVCIHMDNAREFRGDMVARACEQYGIDTVFRPLKTPQYGAHIESLMDKLSDEFRTLPGATFSNPQERGKNYDSEKESALSMAEFCAWFANHVCVIYHYRPHSGLGGKSPIQRWEEGFFKGTELAPALGSLPDRYIGDAAERLRLDFIPFEERVVSEEGVRIDKIHYNSPLLCPWINAKEKQNPNKTRYFTFRRDPRDISIIYFWNPELGKYEPIPYRNAALTPATLWELRAARRHLRDERKIPNNQHTEALIFDAIRRKRDIVEAAKARRKKIKASGQHRPGIHDGRPQPKPPASSQSPGSDTPNPKSTRDDISSFEDVDFD